MPDFTTASAMFLIMSSLTLQANLFHEFQPMGGVSARRAEGAVFSCAIKLGTNTMTNMTTNDERENNDAATGRFVFIDNVLPEPALDSPLQFASFSSKNFAIISSASFVSGNWK